jgi:hypothetical protein
VLLKRIKQRKLNTEFSFYYSATSQILISPVSDSYLREFETNGDESSINFLREKIQAGFDEIDPLISIVSPVVKVSSSSVLPSLQLSLYTSLSESYLSSDSICLGTIDIPGQAWYCTEAEILSTAPFVTYSISSAGIYAILLNGSLSSKALIECSHWGCTHPEQMVLLIITAIGLSLFIVISLWAVSIHTEEARKKVKEMEEYWAQLHENSLKKPAMLIDRYNQSKIEFEEKKRSDEADAMKRMRARRGSGEPLTLQQNLQIKTLRHQIQELEKVNKHLREQSEDLHKMQEENYQNQEIEISFQKQTSYE